LFFTGIYFESQQVFIVGSGVNLDISVTMADRIRTGGHGSSGSIRGRDAQPSIQCVPGVQKNFNLGTKYALRPDKEPNVPSGYENELAAEM
jgi:hypothetical protein